jgi:hypothetical protein
MLTSGNFFLNMYLNIKIVKRKQLKIMLKLARMNVGLSICSTGAVETEKNRSAGSAK